VPTAIIIGIGSDIGHELATRFIADGWTVVGTFRSDARLGGLPQGTRLVECDLASEASTVAAGESLTREGAKWDAIIVAAGTEEPVGAFWDCDAQEWERAMHVNALAPLRLVRRLYADRSAGAQSSVAFFSGSGTNSAAPAYSAYCASKILLIKMCELLDAESGDTKFFIIGPGIVRTKIHAETLKAGARGGANFEKVRAFLESGDPGTSHDDIYACLRWCMGLPKHVIGGRNIALAHDAWRNGGVSLVRSLEQEPEMYKLRRKGNARRITRDGA